MFLFQGCEFRGDVLRISNKDAIPGHVSFAHRVQSNADSAHLIQRDMAYTYFVPLPTDTYKPTLLSVVTPGTVLRARHTKPPLGMVPQRNPNPRPPMGDAFQGAFALISC